ncbi:MAG: apolipoprotein N-acyltransferase, partial [Sphingobacteriaceae bacterium]
PLFMVLAKQQTKQAIRSGLLFGLTIALTSFYWMIPGAERFTGSSVIYGIAVYIISSIILSLFFGLIALCFALLKSKTGNELFNAIVVACIFTIAEFVFMGFSRHFPWFDFHTGNAIADNLYAIQTAEFFGVHILTFIVVLVNYLVAGFLLKKLWIKFLMPVGIVTVFILTGVYLNSRYTVSSKDDLPKIAIVAQNIAPETKWNNETGNNLAKNILNMSATVAQIKPAIALWSESAIPWTYRKDDDLVNEILKITAPAKVTHVLGMNTEYSKKEVYNSAYCLLPDGSIAGRYDKQVLLSLIEAPVAGFIFPFMSSDGFVERPGEYNKPLNTILGKAGIIICNEATVPSVVYRQVNDGAQFILNLSNDGWFSNSYLVDLHFYNVRLRAVETRKDVVVNSNTGYSGLVRSSGDVIMKKKSISSFVDTVSVVPNDYKTLVVAYPHLFIYLCLGGILCFIIVNRTRASV